MSWAQFKDRRNARTVSAVPASSLASPTSKNDRGESKDGTWEQASPAEPPGDVLPYSHPDLPSFLEVRQLPRRGRGVVAKQTISPGTTLFLTSPIVSVLDNRNLATHCSFCFRSRDDTEQQKSLLQCSACRIAQYCNPTCSTVDWKLHKHECKALRAASKATGRRVVPDTPVRALGRLLWKRELEGDKLWEEIASLQSHREALSSEEQQRFFQLSIALLQYVGSQELVGKAVGGSGKGMMDLLSRFTSNSFSLTSPSDLTNIGVSVSPLTALFNHSCTGINAAVVFPSFPSYSKPNHMAVVALREIKPGEEVLTSYVDIVLPREERRRELRERYKFECGCEGCGERKEGAVDPREALECSKEGCGGLIPLPPRSDSAATTTVSCPSCASSYPYKDVYPAIDAAKTALAEAERVQYSDPPLAILHLTHALTGLTTSLLPNPALAPSSHPFLSILQLLLTLQLHSSSFSSALSTAHRAWRGVRLVFPSGHPVRAVLLSTLARLYTVPPPPEEGLGAELAYWSDGAKRREGMGRLVEALKEAETAFGKEGNGREMGRRLRALIRDQEEGISMARRVHEAERS
ncbi:hypothetical protein JCM8547_000191 [Rhodosporidiobolus lusitaniae]